VARVNALIAAYNQAIGDRKELMQAKLRKLVAICEKQGYAHAKRLLKSGLDKKELRALCWNTASFLKDRDVEINLGIKL
jgi:hypothetical protein